MRIIVKGKMNGTGDHFFKLSYPKTIAITLKPGSSPLLYIRNYYDCMLGYEGVSPEPIYYPADSCNSNLAGIIDFFNNNLKNSVLSIQGNTRPGSPPEYENISAYRLAQADVAYWKLYNMAFNDPTTGWWEYAAYRRLVRLCCNFFNIKLTGAIELSFRELCDKYREESNESV